MNETGSLGLNAEFLEYYLACKELIHACHVIQALLNDGLC